MSHSGAAKVRFLRLDWRFDSRPLQAEVERFEPQLWKSHFNTGYHDGGWSGLALISSDGDSARLYPGPDGGRKGRETPALAQSPALRAVLDRLPFTIQSARLLRLAPGSHICEHRDFGIGIDQGNVRLHIPIFSSPEVEFHVDGARVPMAEGECWYLDLGLPHRVVNHGSTTRVHLVVDCDVDDCLVELLAAATDSEERVAALARQAGATSQQAFERFRSEVVQSSELQARLSAIEDMSEFVAQLARIGQQAGHRFTEEDVRAASQAGRRAWFERNTPLSAMVRPGPATAVPPAQDEASALEGWVPVLARAQGDSLHVELCRLGDRRLTEPFFEDSISVCMRQPFHSTLRRRHDAAALARWLSSNPGLAPTGFVFHVSRCGSTLLARALASSAGNRVLSEPGPVDAALNGGPWAADDPRREPWLRAVLGMLARPATPHEQRCFVKFDSWHTLSLRLIRRCYPEVPWVFLVRDPVEVIVSQLRQPGAQMVPGMLGFEPPGVDLAAAALMPREEYIARTLGAYCNAALQEIDASPGRVRVVDYRELPHLLQGPLLSHLGAPADDAVRGAMSETMRHNAKAPAFEFVPDMQSKQQEASDAVRVAADRWVMPAYRGLLARCRFDDGAAT